MKSERERQYDAMDAILNNRTPEKRVMVGYQGKGEKQGDKESHLTKIMKDVRCLLYTSPSPRAS